MRDDITTLCICLDLGLAPLGPPVRASSCPALLETNGPLSADVDLACDETLDGDNNCVSTHAHDYVPQRRARARARNARNAPYANIQCRAKRRLQFD